MKAPIAIASALLLIAAVFMVGDAGQSVACDKAKTAKAEGANAWVTATLAAMPADSKACCKAAVARAITDCYNHAAAAKTANASGCSKSADATTASVKPAASSSCCPASTASAKTASTSSSCSKSSATTASVKTAQSSSCSKSTAAQADYTTACVQNALAAMSPESHECCREAVAAAMEKVAQHCVAGADMASVASTTGSANYHCSSSAATTAMSASSGCSKSAAARTAGTIACDKSTKTAGTSEYAKSSCSKNATASLVYADINQDVGKRVELTGHAVCGKCTLEATEACQSLFQTADGKIYKLIDNKVVKDLRKAESDSDKGFKIVTRVRETDNGKVLEVENFKAL